MSKHARVQNSFFFLLFGLAGIIIFFIYRPFLEIILFSIVLAVMLQPIFNRILRVTRNNREIAAVTTILLTAIFIAIPLYFLGVQIVKETTGLYAAVSADGGAGGVVAKISHTIDTAVNQAFPALAFSTESYLQNFIGVIYQNVGPLVSGTAFVLVGLILVLLSLFFFLKDGPMFLDGFLELSPLDDHYDRDILSTFNKTVKSVLLGTLAVEVVQGFVLMLGFTIFGVPNAVLWGSVTIVLAAVPGLGAMAVFVPGILYLFYINHTVAAAGLLIWSFLIHGSVDNFLTPILYGKGMNVHPIFVMFSILGGILFFGPLGFLFGPLALALFIALFHIYKILILRQE